MTFWPFKHHIPNKQLLEHPLGFPPMFHPCVFHPNLFSYHRCMLKSSFQNASNKTLLGKRQITSLNSLTQNKQTFIPTRMAFIQKQKITCAGKKGRNCNPHTWLLGNVKMAQLHGNTLDSFSKRYHRITIRPSHPTPRQTLREMKDKSTQQIRIEKEKDVCFPTVK